MDRLFINEYRSDEIEKKINNNEIKNAVVTFGSCESHGNHLPLGTDKFLADGLAKEIVKKCEGSILVPSVPFGTSIHYNKFPLSITFEYETLIKIAEDIFSSLIKNNIKNIIVINGHDGNIPGLEIACRNIKDRYSEAKILYIPGWWFYSSQKLEKEFSYNGGRGHGGEAETSLSLFINPELVDMSKTEKEVCKKIDALNRYNINLILDIKEKSKFGSTGDSRKATYEKGEMIFNNFTDYVVEIINGLNEEGWDYGYKI